MTDKKGREMKIDLGDLFLLVSAALTPTHSPLHETHSSCSLTTIYGAKLSIQEVEVMVSSGLCLPHSAWPLHPVQQHSCYTWLATHSLPLKTDLHHFKEYRC